MLLLTLVLLAAAPARAATPPGVVGGLARDALQRPLAGVHLRLEAPDGRVVASATSGPDGAYRFAGIAPGIYSVVAEQEGFETATAVVSLEAGAGASADLTLASQQPLDLSVVAKQLEAARTSIQPRVGATTYSIPAQAIENQPGGGENNPLNQVVLQAPGVSQDSFGQIHVRNEHANVQYRIDGVILPEGVSVFGQSLSPRIAGSVDLITGTLPAEYGLRTAGIVDIQTRSGAFTPGGAVGIYGGSHGLLEPSAEYGGSIGSFNYFVAGDYLQDGAGIEPPTRAYHPTHDATEQGHGFAYLEDILNATSKVSAIFGTYRGQFQIPDLPGQTPSFHADGITAFDSAKLDENQREINHYGVLAYLKSTQDFDFQISGFARYSSLSFRPDPLGDLLFNGIAQSAYRRSFASGLQAEAAYRIAIDHTLRSGVIITGERTTSETTSLVLAAIGGVQVPPDTPFAIADNAAKTGWTYSIYLQDEWRVTPTITLNYGGRFDVVDAFTHENQLSPRANAVWKATPTTTVHAGYANYFTPPPFELVGTTSIAKFIGTTGEPGVLLDNTVKAERAHYFDIGIEQQVLPGLKAGIDAYYKYSRNLIDEGQFGAPIILTPFNYHFARNLGVELTTSYESGPFSFYGNLALAQQKAEHIVSSEFNFSPDDLAFIAAHAIHTDHDQFMTASAGASYLWQGTRFSIDVLAGSGLRRNNGSPNGGALPSYEQINLGISHKFEIPGTGPVEVRVDLINIFDEVYKIRDGTGVGVGAPQFGPRRTVFAGFKKEF
jgi:outer membrane receptor protein involved in Fe transport